MLQGVRERERNVGAVERDDDVRSGRGGNVGRDPKTECAESRHRPTDFICLAFNDQARHLVQVQHFHHINLSTDIRKLRDSITA
jgi:hypothetical protein